MKRLTYLFLMLLAMVGWSSGAWAEGPFTFTSWTSGTGSANANWTSYTGHKFNSAYYRQQTGVAFATGGDLTVTFTFKSGGNKRFETYGVDLLDSKGTVVKSDYHHGWAGGQHSGNTYSLTGISAGTYTVRYWSARYGDDGTDFLASGNTSEGTIATTYSGTCSTEFTVTTWNMLNDWTEGVTNVPANLQKCISDTGYGTNQNLYYHDDADLEFSEPVTYNIHLQYGTGSWGLDFKGIELMNGSGEIVSADYHHGFVGGNPRNPDYKINVPAAGTYTLRIIAQSSDINSTNNCTGSITYTRAVSLSDAIAGTDNLGSLSLSVNDGGNSTISASNGTITINNSNGVSTSNSSNYATSTISFRINLSTPTAFSRIVTLSAGSNAATAGNNVGIGMDTDGKLYGTTSGGKWGSLASNSVVEAGSHVITVVLNSGTTIYVDGTQKGTASGLRYGSTNYNNVIFDPAYSSAIDAVYVFNSALSANDIATVTSEIREIPAPEVDPNSIYSTKDAPKYFTLTNLRVSKYADSQTIGGQITEQTSLGVGSFWHFEQATATVEDGIIPCYIYNEYVGKYLTNQEPAQYSDTPTKIWYIIPHTKTYTGYCISENANKSNSWNDHAGNYVCDYGGDDAGSIWMYAEATPAQVYAVLKPAATDANNNRPETLGQVGSYSTAAYEALGTALSTVSDEATIENIKTLNAALYAAKNSLQLPVDGKIYSIYGLLTKPEPDVINYLEVTADGAFTITQGAATEGLQSLWVAHAKDADTFTFTSAADPSKYLSAETGVQTTEYTWDLSIGTVAGRLSMFNGTLYDSNGRFVASKSNGNAFGKWNEGGHWANEPGQWNTYSTDFVFTENTSYNVYNVVVTGLPSSLVGYAVIDGKNIANGSSVVTSTTIDADHLDDVSATAIPGYDYTKSFADGTITVTYTLGSTLFNAEGTDLNGEGVKYVRISNVRNAYSVYANSGDGLHSHATDYTDENELFALVGTADNFKLYSKTQKKYYGYANGNQNSTVTAAETTNQAFKFVLNNTNEHKGYNIVPTTNEGNSFNMLNGAGNDIAFWGTGDGGSTWNVTLIDKTAQGGVIYAGTEPQSACNTKLGKVTMTNGTSTSTLSYNVGDTKLGTKTYYLNSAYPFSMSVNMCFRGYNATVSDDGMTVTFTADEDNEYQYLWYSTDAPHPYRIPAIATLKNGDLIAVNDYRPCGGDIGNGKVDLVKRISHDNGAHWTTGETIIEGITNDNTNWNDGFGDPAICVDRESGKVLLMCVTGRKVCTGATRQDPNRVARFYSNDGGVTFTNLAGNGTYDDITEEVYQLWDADPQDNYTMQSVFIGSGRIFQSKVIKAPGAQYYRIYAALWTRDMHNRVAYSDDFGETWHILGTRTDMPFPSFGNANEPKCEELPDGSVIMASRKPYGRYYNIFTYTDAVAGQGSWSTGSNASFSTSDGNGTNGETMVIQAKKPGDTTVYTVALQSLPWGSARSHVGFYYKDITDAATYQTDGANDAAKFAADWTQGMQVTDRDAGYSTFTIQQDGKVGFFYEEGPAGYEMVYVPLTIAEITKGVYSEIVQDCTPQLQAAITAAEPLLEESTKVGYRKDVNGALKAAMDAAKAKIEAGEKVTMEDVTALTDAAATYEASTEVNMPQAGHLYRIYYVMSNGQKYGVYRKTAGGFGVSQSETPTHFFFKENGEYWSLMAPQGDGKFMNYTGGEDNNEFALHLNTCSNNHVPHGFIPTLHDATSYKTLEGNAGGGLGYYSNKIFDKWATDASTHILIEEVTDYYNVSVITPEGTNFRALTTGGAYAYNGGYLVFDEVPTEGNFQNEHNPEEVDMAVTVTDNVIQVSYEAKPKFFTNNTEKLLNTIGHPINEEYTALKEAYDAYMHAASDAGLDALKEAMVAYENTLTVTTNVATSVVLPTGYYYIANADNRGALYNDYELCDQYAANQKQYTLQTANSSTLETTNKGIWRVINNGNGTISVLNGQGSPMYTNHGQTLQLNTLTFGTYYAGSNPRNAIFFTEALNASNGGSHTVTMNDTGYRYLGTWTAGNGANDNHWTFEPVEGDFWTVKIMGGDYVKSADQTPQYMRDGGFMAFDHTPAIADFTMQGFTEEDVEMSVFTNEEEKVVTISYGKTKFDPRKEEHRAVWREVNQALAKVGLGYPRCNILPDGSRDHESGSTARTNLFNATKLIDIAYAADSNKEENETALYLETFQALLDAYYTDSDVEMPQEGHVYAFEAHFFDKTNGIALDDNAHSLYITDTNEAFNANLVKWNGEDNGMKMTNSKSTGYLQNGAYWMAHKDASGKYYFVSAIGNKMGEKTLHTSLTENKMFYLCQSAAYNNKTTGYATFGDFSLRVGSNTGDFMGTGKNGTMITGGSDNQNGSNQTYAWRLVEADMNYVYSVNVNSDKPSSCPTIQPQVIVTLAGNLKGFNFTEKASGYGFFVLDADILRGGVTWSANDILNGDPADPYRRLIAGTVAVNGTNKTIDVPYTFDYETVLPKLYAATDNMLQQTGFGYPKVGVNEETREADVTKDWRAETTVRADLNTVLTAQKSYVQAENYTDKAAAAACYNALMTAQANYYGNMTDADIIIPANGVPVLLVNEFRNEALATTYRNFAYDKMNSDESLTLTLAMPETRTAAEGKDNESNILPASVEDPLLFARYIWTIQRDNEEYITQVNETSTETAYTGADKYARTQSGAANMTAEAAELAGYVRPSEEVTPTVSEDGLTSTYVYKVMIQGADGQLNRVNSNTSTRYSAGNDDLEKSMSTIKGTYDKRAEYDQVYVRETRTVVKTQKTTTIPQEVDVIGEDGLPTGAKDTVQVVVPVYSYNDKEVTEATHQEGEGDEAHDVPNEPVYNSTETSVYEQITEHVVEKVANVAVDRNFPTYYISATVGDGYIGRESIRSARAILTTDHRLQFNVAFVKGTRIGTIGMLFVFSEDPQNPRYISGDLKGSRFDRYNFQTGYDTEHATKFGGIWSTDWNFVNVTTVNTHKEGDQLMVGNEYVKVDGGKGELSPVEPEEKVVTTKDILSWSAPIFEGYPVKFAASDTEPVDKNPTADDQDKQHSYATLKLPYAVYLPVGVTQHVYTLKAVHPGSVETRKQLELTDVINQLTVTLGGKTCIILPRETPVLIEHNALDKYYLSPALALQSLATSEQIEQLNAAVAGNLFKGTLGRQKVSEIASVPFVLAKKKARAVVEVDGSPTFGKEFNTVAFYRYTGSYMPANKAFVDWSEVEITEAPAGVRAQSWMIDDEEEQYIETSVGDLLLEVDTETGAVYDITGRKFDRAPRQGVYIQNGKKYIAK